MNIYVETNFVLELVFQQEQSASCESILAFCESGRAQLIIPAYSLAEPHEKILRQAKSRRELQQLLDAELRQLTRTESYATRINSLQDIARLLIQSNEEEQNRFDTYRDRLLRIVHVVPLSATVLAEAAINEDSFDLQPQDSLVYTSVIAHLRQSDPTHACFLNRNSKDFNNPDIIDELNGYNCRLITRFDQGFDFVQAQSSNYSSEQQQ